MHGVMQQIQQQEGRDKAHIHIGDWPGGERDTQRALELRTECHRRREDKCREDDVEEPQAEIAKAAAQRWELTPPPRPAKFPNRYQEQGTEDDSESYQGFLPRLVIRSSLHYS